MNNYNSNYTNTVNRGLTLIIDFYKAPAIKLVQHLMKEHNYSLEKIGGILGMSKQAVSASWSKLPEEETK